VGKRATLYIQDLLMDLDYLEHLEQQVMARGAKGTVGTQATFPWSCSRVTMKRSGSLTALSLPNSALTGASR
jgi:adenylosuccinate lyase